MRRKKSCNFFLSWGVDFHKGSRVRSCELCWDHLWTVEKSCCNSLEEALVEYSNETCPKTSSGYVYEKLEQYGLLCCKQSFISTPTMIGLYLLPAAVSLFSPLSSGAFILVHNSRNLPVLFIAPIAAAEFSDTILFSTIPTRYAGASDPVGH
jgi:hypothetical protein